MIARTQDFFRTPGNTLGLCALVFSLCFSSLPSAMADGATAIASKAGIVKRARLADQAIEARNADSARKLNGRRSVDAASKVVGTRKGRNKLVALDRSGHLPAAAIPASIRSAGAARGPQGPAGARGERGDDGKTGARGAQGLQGERGLQGAQGPQGAQGDPGSLTDIVIRSATSITGNGTAARSARASCQEGERLIGIDAFLVNGSGTVVTGVGAASTIVTFVANSAGQPIGDNATGAMNAAASAIPGSGNVLTVQATCAVLPA